MCAQNARADRERNGSRNGIVQRDIITPTWSRHACARQRLWKLFCISKPINDGENEFHRARPTAISIRIYEGITRARG